MAKSADMHFEPDGSIRLIGRSTADSAEFVSTIARTAASFADSPMIVGRVWTEDSGTTLVVESQLYPVGAKPVPRAKPEPEKPAGKAKSRPPAKPKTRAKTRRPRTR